MEVGPRVRQRTAGRDDGQGVAEFALVLIPLLLILFGIFDFGRAVYAYNTIADAARTAARVGIVNQDKNLIAQTAATQALALGIQAANVQVGFKDGTTALDCAVPIRVRFCDVVVTVPYTYTAATPFIGLIVGTIQLSSTSRLAVESIMPLAAPTAAPTP